ncbi:BTAD domain-containing putative transcriptional regulator [Streptomyces sp. C11-1]|uniref:BTAD domain-containing putative transcriptional regulator n=1 Tax=Streptomyces durocortorensis TaxID=2811104 RepID=A0ABY9W7M5_9ACTN|nr:BTAD domain-containing putative transcriptional regulator [Streptomyces durocortorensis]WNF29341.1 BTAD domain-containing putative transcriptional regulator [Streptomyces durocortorensis]
MAFLPAEGAAEGADAGAVETEAPGVLAFRLLGPVSATREGAPVPLSGTKIHTVLAVLLLARGALVADSRLSAALWGDAPPPTSNAQIYTYVSRLRKTLGNRVEIFRKGPGYVLDVRAAEVDLFSFERLDRLGRRALEEGRHEEAGRLLGGALDCWSGHALENVTEHLLQFERPRLEFLRAQALERRIEADLSLGRHRSLVPELLSLVARFPMDENLRAHLITALHRSDRQAEAVQVYGEGRRILDEQLGVVPGRRLSTAYLRMLRGEGPGLPPRRPPVLLPARAAAFTGRTAEAARLRSLLLSRPSDPAARLRAALVTGMPGSGKTALAAEVAHGCAEAFPDGVVHAELHDADGAARPPGAVLGDILAALGEAGSAERTTDRNGLTTRHGLNELVGRYRARTADARLLVVLDDASSDVQLTGLLPAGPDSALLVTSRGRPACVPAVHTVGLGPLGDEDAAALLAETVGAERTGAEPGAVRDLVRHCAGLPLALRIAAARLAARPHRTIARFADRLADPRTRLAALSYGRLDLARTLGRALTRLSPATAALVPWLAAVGPGPFTARLAGELTGLTEAQAEHALEELVDGSLLLAEPDGHLGEGRYRFHSLVLLYADTTPRRELPR